ncbi:hypothetical protein ASE34_01575 [Microbacterium sp. Root280D1]|nr:hypothetical protein ASE34_01575 [Microbacterium sp. Root280D1]
MHFNLLDRESQGTCLEADVNTAERPERFQTWSLRHHVEQVFSGLGISAGGALEIRAGDAVNLQARV